jgi:hypothetical protein
MGDHRFHVAQLPGVEHLLHAPFGRGSASLMTDLEEDIGIPGGFDRGDSVFHRVGEWLLHVYVLARRRCLLDQVSMALMRSGDEHTLDLGIGQELLQGPRRPAAMLGCKLISAFGLAGVAGHDLCHPAFRDRIRQCRSPPAETDAAQPDLVRQDSPSIRKGDPICCVISGRKPPDQHDDPGEHAGLLVGDAAWGPARR